MIEPDSPIIDFYPEEFDIDMNGKKMSWQGVALLPFIDQHRLLSALASKEGELTEDEKRRNRWGDNVIFIGEGNLLYDAFCDLYGLKATNKVSASVSQGKAEKHDDHPLTHLAPHPRHDALSRHIRLRSRSALIRPQQRIRDSTPQHPRMSRSHFQLCAFRTVLLPSSSAQTQVSRLERLSTG